ncbi:MAG: response regulator [Deltaproteobacteria bacterium]|nr:response regulator [Deltaproteobacteria bacterium]
MAKVIEHRPIQSLIVDDDRSIGEILKELVSRCGVSVEAFSDGQDAIEFIKRQPVDIVITDLMMPKVGGLEVLHFAKNTNPDSVVIIITGHASLETAIEAVRKGAYDYIKKPFKLQEVKIAFNNAVERIELVRKNRELLLELKDAYDQLVILKKDGNKVKDEDEPESHKIAYLNFFSNALPSLEFFHKAREEQHGLFERLENISQLKKDGLLTDGEFKKLKRHVIKCVGGSKA